MIRCKKSRCAVYSHKTGKRLSKVGSRKSAVKRLRQIKYFSRRK